MDKDDRELKDQSYAVQETKPGTPEGSELRVLQTEELKQGLHRVEISEFSRSRG